MEGTGFQFRYRLGGGAPSVKRFRAAGGEGLAAGDVVGFASGTVHRASCGDDALIGAVVAAAPVLPVVTDADAVYAVVDPKRPQTGTTLDLTGDGGLQGLRDDGTADFEVVVGLLGARGDARSDQCRPAREVLPLPDADAASAADARARRARSPGRERALVAAAAAGDPTACAQLVEAHLPAIAGMARLYRGAATVERAELLQEGVVGLLRALKRFDPNLGVPFWAYASWWVRQAMQQLVSEVTGPAVLSDRAQRRLAQVREARGAHLQSHGREPTTDQLAEITELPRGQIVSLLAVERTPRGLEEHVPGDEGGGTLKELIVDPVAEQAYERVIERMEIDQVRDLAEALDDRGRSILYDHYGLGRPAKTLREIGEALGVSAERVRQIEEQTLAKLRLGVASGTLDP